MSGMPSSFPTVCHPSACNRSFQITLLGGFTISAESCVLAVPTAARRVITVLAVHQRHLARGYVAGTLWGETGDAQASANLRAVLWRLRQLSIDVVEAFGGQLRLHDAVHVDFRDTLELAHLLTGRTPADATATPDHTAIAALSLDLLPEDYDDWLMPERERWRQVRLHALEALATSLRQHGQFSAALEAGLAAVAVEPLRETAHRSVIETHLAEGNYGEALRQYRLFSELLGDELGIAPSLTLAQLIARPNGTPLRTAVVDLV